MKEYIERAAAINAIRQYQYPYGVEFLLANLPTADVAEVRHGRWIGIPIIVNGSALTAVEWRENANPYLQVVWCSHGQGGQQ